MQSGRMSSAVLAFLASVLVFAGLLATLFWTQRRPQMASGAPNTSAELMVYCAPALKVPVETIRDRYQALTGTTIRIQFSPSQTILTSAEISRRGDLFLPADDSYTAKARDKGLLDESIPLLRMHAVIVVRKGNPKNVHKLSDLERDDVKTVLAGEAAA